MLVSSFAGYDLIMKGYRVAIERRYDFLSYGDSMLLL
jgi:S-adenosylmethionine:tRNA ribosyltransferase-isomerase